MTIARGVTGSVGSIASDIVDGEEISWGSAVVSGLVGTFFGFLSGGGAQNNNSTLKFKIAQRKQRLAEGKSTRAIDTQIRNECNLLKNKALKEVMLDLDHLYTFAIEYPILSTLDIIEW